MASAVFMKVDTIGSATTFVTSTFIKTTLAIALDFRIAVLPRGFHPTNFGWNFNGSAFDPIEWSEEVKISLVYSQ